MTDEVVYRFAPRFAGEFVRGVPARDLTQRDIDRLEPLAARDAFAPHPLYGTPLYVKPGDDGKPPKWFLDKQEKAGAPIEPMLPNETQRQYDDRIAALAAPTGDEDGEP